MGQTDNLCGHNDLVGAFRRMGHTDVFATVMKPDRNLQEQALPLLHTVNPLHFVENGESQIFCSLKMGLITLIALGNVLGRLDDIVFKIMAGLEDPFALRVIVSQTVPDIQTRYPDEFCSGFFNQLPVNNKRRQYQRHVLSHTAQSLHGFLPGAVRKNLFVQIQIFLAGKGYTLRLTAPVYQLIDIIAYQNHMLNFMILQI